jgi:predicted nucleic acid-binding protein
MSALVFLDTNILLYSISADPGETAKRDRAIELLDRDDVALSVQVLQEFYEQATRASRADPIPHDVARALMRTWTRFPIQDTSLSVLEAALDLRESFGFSSWDAAIIAAAQILGRRRLYTEDLSHGQRVGSVIITNPFL